MKHFILLVLLLASSFYSPLQAQLLKKIERGIQNAAEKVAEQKITDLINQEFEEAIDSTLNHSEPEPTESKSEEQQSYKPRIGGFGLSKATPAESYSFDHKIEMQIDIDGKHQDIDYYIADNQDYLGTVVKNEALQDESITVLDGSRETIFTFMEMNGSKVRMAIDFGAEDLEDLNDDVTVKETGNNKTIMGYNCKEYYIVDPEYTSNVWVTSDTDIRFPQSVYQVPQNKENNQDWMKNIDGWAMEMEMTETSKRKPTVIKMKCLSIEKTQFKIITNDYSKL